MLMNVNILSRVVPIRRAPFLRGGGKCVFAIFRTNVFHASHHNECDPAHNCIPSPMTHQKRANTHQYHTLVPFLNTRINETCSIITRLAFHIVSWLCGAHAIQYAAGKWDGLGRIGGGDDATVSWPVVECRVME